MTWYQTIVPVNQPAEIGLDSSGRVQVVFTINVVKGPSTTFEQELLALLVAAPAIGAFGTSIFIGDKALIPAEGGPFLHIKAEGGAGPLYIHNDPGPAYPRPNATLTVCAPSLAAAKTMAWAAWNRLAVVRNRQVTP